MTDNDTKQLKGAFGEKGTKVNQIAYGHPNAQDIIEEARKILMNSDTGRLMLSIHFLHKVPIHVIKGTGDSGYNVQSKIIYLQIPGKTAKLDAKTLLQLVKALREADQELIGFTAPDPMKDVMKYAAVMHSKNLDSIVYVCKVVKELLGVMKFPELLDGMKDLGFNDVYKAYVKNASKEELFDAYAGR